MTNKKNNQEELFEKLLLHSAWINEASEGEQLLMLDANISDISCDRGNFENSVLVRCVIENATFIECNFLRVKFFDTVFRNCSFLNCYMRRAELNGADFSDVDFTGSHLAKAEFFEAKGQRANFTNCDLGYTYMGDADLRYAIFENASFIRTHFGGGKLYNTRKFHIRSFDKATLIEGVDISAKGDGTILIHSLEELVNYLAITD
jgi:uncharacterized protein YjbI with pentapeptide repeats